MKIKAVFFDLDGTLLPMDQDIFIKAYLGGLSGLLAPKGYDPKAIAGALWKSTDAMVKNDGNHTNEEVFWKNFCAILGDEIRGEEPLLDEFYRTDFQKVREYCGYNPMSKALVDKLNASGIKVLLATNPLFPAAATESRMRWAGLSPDDFIFYTTYENSRYCKPNLEYYKWLLAKADISANECLMVGNDVGDDMVAEKLGMKVFLLTDCLINKTENNVTDFKHGNFAELVKYIEELI